MGEESFGDEGEVGVAAAEVDDLQGFLGGRPAQVALGESVGDRGVEDPQELLDLAVLALPARLHPALVVAEPERTEDRVVLGQ